jgi:hypothetical protein
MVEEIIDNAIYKSLQDRALDPSIDSQYVLLGLSELNNILDSWRDYIPFNSTVTFNNVNNLMNSKFTDVTSVNYVINNVSFSNLKSVDLVTFKNMQNIIGLLGFPKIYYYDQLSQTIEVYPLPSNPEYQFTVWGRIQQISLGLKDKIPANMPLFMVKAVTYELAFILASEYGSPWDSKKESIRTTSFELLKKKKIFNLKPQSNIVFGRPNSRNAPPFPWLYYMSGGGQ